MQARTKPNFGYSWVWQYGHIVPTAVFGLTAAVSLNHGGPGWLTTIFAALAIWALAGFLVTHFKFRMNALMTLPTQRYLPDGGRVLDIGCGSGRTSIMVASALPNCEVVALDNFSADYIKSHGLDNTRANFLAVGMEDRISLQEGDMRELPFEDQHFDGTVSSYAIDHLDPAEIPRVFQEVNRVLKDDAQFLLMVIVPNIWTAIAYGPMVHLGFPKHVFWRTTFEQAGFAIEEEGCYGGAAFFLAKKTRAYSSDLATAASTPVFKPSKRLKFHGADAHNVIAAMAISGFALLLFTLALNVFGTGVSWWWVAAAIPIGMHVGLILVAVSAVTRWLAPKENV